METLNNTNTKYLSHADVSDAIWQHSGDSLDGHLMLLTDVNHCSIQLNSDIFGTRGFHPDTTRPCVHDYREIVSSGIFHQHVLADSHEVVPCSIKCNEMWISEYAACTL